MAERVFDSIAGLPLHSLVVHAVVVLVPIAALGAVLVAFVPRWNRRFGVVLVGIALVGAVSAFVAKESGEVLASRVGTPQDHFAVARWLPWIALALFVLVTLLWWVDRARPGTTESGPGRRPQRTTGGKVLAVLTLVVAVVALGWTIRAGHTGAQSVWGTTIQSTTPDSQPVG